MRNPEPTKLSNRQLVHHRSGVRVQSATTASFAPVVHTLVGLVVVMLLISGCVVGPDFSQPPPQNLQLDYLAKAGTVGSETTGALDQWWRTLNDPALDALLQSAQSENLTLREAYERIVEARANLRLQGGQLRPNGNLESSYSFEKNSPNSRPFVGSNGDPFNLFNLGIDTTWEIDLFGRIARTIEAADAELQFQENEYEAVRQTLFADIVSSYLRLRTLQTQMMLLEEGLQIQAQTESLVSDRLEAGVSTKLDQSQTVSFKFRTLTLLASLRQQLDVEFNQLSLLLGQSPNIQLKEYLGVAPLPAMPPIPDVGFPADLLRRRPDVRREEMAVRAASALIGVAEADLYPQLTLLGNVNLSAQTVSSLFETDGLEFSVGPSFQWNIFHFGRIFDNIEVQQASFRQSIARYQNQALIAVREVEDALANHTGFRVQWLTLKQAIEADENAVKLSLERYRAGKANFQRVVDAQQQLVNDQQQFFQMQLLATTQLVRLFKAAGGDWGIGTVNSGCFECGPVVGGHSYIVDANSFPVSHGNAQIFVEADPVPQSVFQQTPTPAQQYAEPFQPTLQQFPAAEHLQPTMIQPPNAESGQPSLFQPPAVESIPDSVPFPLLGNVPAIPTATANNGNQVRQATHVDNKAESDSLFSKLYR